MCTPGRVARIGFLTIIGLTTGQVVFAWALFFNNPSIGARFAPSATINFSGNFSWASNEPSMDLIGVYSMLNNSSPLVGVIASSTYANRIVTSLPPNGGGSGTFDSVGVNPPLTAPSSITNFWVTGLGENAVQGYFYKNGPNNPPEMTAQSAYTQ